jgi:hypothetical protein
MSKNEKNVEDVAIQDVAIPGVIPKNHKIRTVGHYPYGEWARGLSPNQAQGLRDEARVLLRENAGLFERASRNSTHSAATRSVLNSDNPPALIELYEVINFG